MNNKVIQQEVETFILESFLELFRLVRDTRQQ